MLSQPSLSLGGTPFTADLEPQPALSVNRLAQWFICPIHFGSCDDLIVGGERQSDWHGEVAPLSWIAMSRGEIYLAVLPMAWSLVDGPAKVERLISGRYECIRAKWHDGQPRAFERHELASMFGGWIIEHAPRSQYASLNEFAYRLAASTVTDAFFAGRWIEYQSPMSGARFEAHVSPGATVPRFISHKPGPGRIHEAVPPALRGAALPQIRCLALSDRTV